MSIYSRLVNVGDWRRRELAQLKSMLPSETNSTFECLCRGMLVLCYSHWEGYFNDLTEQIFGQTHAEELSRSGLGTTFQCLFMRSDIDQLIGSNLTDDGVVRFLKAHELSQQGVKSLNLALVKSRSSLNWDRLSAVADIYGFSWIKFQKKRIFIDHKLCRIRHQIAHGDSPRFTRGLAIEIVDETLGLLDDLAEYFSEVERRISLAVRAVP